jgi:AcrR family transcriptional regulator
MSTAMPSRQAERSERSTSALLGAAADLIVEGGFTSLTFAAIGERAGYSRGLVTARFGSKAGLMEALIHHIVGRWHHRNVLPEADGKPGLEGLLIVLDAIRAQAERDPRGLHVLYALIFEAVGHDELLRSRFAVFHQGMRDDFADLIRRGIRDGSIRATVEPAREAVSIVAELRGIGYQWLLDREGFQLSGPLRHLVATTRDRLSA